MQILAGPRQVGKTTLVRQLLANRPAQSGLYVAADEPERSTAGASFPAAADDVRSRGGSFNSSWLIEQWRGATRAALAWRESKSRLPDAPQTFVLVIDEIQKVTQWSETIKGLWDRDIADGIPMHVVLLGSAPLLMQSGLSESLAGRYEAMAMSHWSFEEMNDAFGFTLDQYLYFGGFPGSATRVHDEERWRSYVVDSLIKPNIEKDILMMTRVDKPALLKHLFDVGCAYSGQIVSLDKTLGQLNDAGNVTTLARYLELLEQAGLLAGLQKYSDHELRRRKSPPKFQVLNNALMSAKGTHSFDEARADRSHWGRLVESAVGAHLVNTAGGDTRIHYWREASLEVDFVVEHRGKLAAVEVKSGKTTLLQRGLAEFAKRHEDCVTLLVGSDALPVGEFLRHPAAHWLV
ncbi:MAG: ATP-binding protein [Rhizobacter sp.]